MLWRNRRQKTVHVREHYRRPPRRSHGRGKGLLLFLALILISVALYFLVQFLQHYFMWILLVLGLFIGSIVLVGILNYLHKRSLKAHWEIRQQRKPPVQEAANPRRTANLQAYVPPLPELQPSPLPPQQRPASTQPVIESPIEQMFWQQWQQWIEYADLKFHLIRQYHILNYRVDFAHEATRTAIELDGWATHSSTEAIAKDRKRQRAIEEAGWHVIRFGGKEITDNPAECVRETWRLIEKRARKHSQ